jgi:hypothetical protein
MRNASCLLDCLAEVEMKIVTFPEQTVVFARDQSRYRPLPAYKAKGDAEGRVVCCWRLSFTDRLALLFTGRLWHSVLTFNAPLQPQLLSVWKPMMQQSQRSQS